MNNEISLDFKYCSEDFCGLLVHRGKRKVRLEKDVWNTPRTTFHFLTENV